MQECDGSTSSLRTFTCVILGSSSLPSAQNSVQHRGSHAKVAAECTGYGQWPKSGVGIQPSQMTISGLGIFFIQSVSTYVSSDSSVSFFLSLIKIYTQNFRLHYFLNHHHLKISTNNIVSFPQHTCIVTGRGIRRVSLSHNNGQEVVPLATDIPASWEPPGRRLSVSSLYSAMLNATHALTCNSKSRS